MEELLEKFVTGPFSRFEWRDGLDILLLTLIFFGIYRYASSRRAGRALIGLVALSFLLLAFIALELPVLGLVSRTIFSIGILCILVIFQPEIRSMLEKIGNNNLFSPGSATVKKKKYVIAKVTVEETVKAVFDMSESKTGALIVFEGVTKLGEYIATGKMVECAVTAPLLKNLFFDKAPLHDGALIISNFHIVAASCVLPLSRNEQMYEGMGTRHRAAGGITEVSDALSVVVSEETGTVSVAQNGLLIRDVNRDQLEDILLTYLAGDLYGKYGKKREEA